MAQGDHSTVHYRACTEEVHHQVPDQIKHSWTNLQMPVITMGIGDMCKMRSFVSSISI